MKGSDDEIVYLEKKRKRELENTYSVVNIDNVLQMHGLFRLQNFAYAVGDCLFNALQVLLDFRYTATEIREGIIEHFRACLEKQDEEAIRSYELELNSNSLIEMHNVNDPEIYLDKMCKSAVIDILPEDRGLWGDIFCVHWASNWLRRPIRIWSKSQARSYLHFNSTLSTDTYDILFHDENPLAGHFEPLLSKNQIDGCSNIEQSKVQKFNMPRTMDGESSLQKVSLENNRQEKLSLRTMKSLSRKKSFKHSNIEENKVQKLHMPKNIDAESCLQKLFLENQSQRSPSLRNIKSLIRNKAFEQKPCDRINEDIKTNRYSLQSSTKKRKNIEPAVVQEENNSCKETFTIAEKNSINKLQMCLYSIA